MKEATSLVPHYIMLSIFFLAGAICFIVALANAKWFFNSRNIGFLRGYLNSKWIRIVYAIIGIVLMVLALVFYYNLQQIELQKVLNQ